MVVELPRRAPRSVGRRRTGFYPNVRPSHRGRCGRWESTGSGSYACYASRAVLSMRGRRGGHAQGSDAMLRARNHHGGTQPRAAGLRAPPNCSYTAAPLAGGPSLLLGWAIWLRQHCNGRCSRCRLPRVQLPHSLASSGRGDNLQSCLQSFNERQLTLRSTQSYPPRDIQLLAVKNWLDWSKGGQEAC